MILLEDKIINLPPKIDELLLFALCFLAFIKCYLGESLHIAFSRRGRLTKIRIVLYIIHLLVIGYAVLFRKVTIVELQNYLLMYAFVEVILLLSSISQVHKAQVGTKEIIKTNLSETYAYAAYNYGYSWSNFARDNAATVLIVAYLFTFNEVAYYSVALLIPNMVRGFTPSKVFAGFLMPSFVKKYTKYDDPSQIFTGLNFIGKLNILYLVPAVVFCIFNYDFFIEWFFDQQYLNQTSSIVIFFFMNITILAFIDLFVLSANVFNKANLVFKVNLASISNIFLLFILQEFGIVSIGISNFLSTLLTVFIFWHTTKKNWQSTIRIYLLDYRVFIYASSLSLMFFILNFLPSVIYLVLTFLIAVLSMYMFVNTSFFSSADKDLLKSFHPWVEKIVI